MLKFTPKFKSLLLVLVLVLSQQVLAQTKTHEVGVKISSLNNFSLLYKVQRSPIKFIRYGLNFSASTSLSESQKTFGINLGFNMGFERRLSINENLQFLRGFNPGVSYNYSQKYLNNVKTNTMGVNASLGYILGFQYNFAKRFSVGVEIIPTLNVGTPDVLDFKTVNVSAGLSPNAGITLVYQFDTEKKSK